MTSWKLEEAKNRFSEVVRRALAHEPQLVTRHGKDAVVVLSVDDYERLTGSRDLLEFLRQSPFADAVNSGELDLERARDLDRDVPL